MQGRFGNLQSDIRKESTVCYKVKRKIPETSVSGRIASFCFQLIFMAIIPIKFNKRTDRLGQYRANDSAPLTFLIVLNLVQPIMYRLSWIECLYGRLTGADRSSELAVHMSKLVSTRVMRCSTSVLSTWLNYSTSNIIGFALCGSNPIFRHKNTSYRSLLSFLTSNATIPYRKTSYIVSWPTPIYRERMDHMRKIAMTLLAFVMIVAGSSSAFAATAMEPDSSSNPNIFYAPNDYFTGTISSYSDTDYFRWTNDTGSAKTYWVYLYNLDDPSLDYWIYSVSVSGSSPGSFSQYFDQMGRECWTVYVPANSVLNVEVRASDPSKVNPTSRYEIVLRSVPPAPW